MKTLTTTVRAELVEAHVGSPSLRATRQNQALKLLLRLTAVSGVLGKEFKNA